jgi:carbonic anhydrase
MCTQCHVDGMSRRHFLRSGAAGLTATALFGPRASIAADYSRAPMTPREALDALKAGNTKYVFHPESCALDLDRPQPPSFAEPDPWASIIACADCRAPPELIFGGRATGELFVARNAGNLLDASTLTTAEYGAAVLRTPLLVVLTHTECATVKAACDFVEKRSTFPGSIGHMIHAIIPAAMAVQGQSGDFVTNAAKESARRTGKRLSRASSLIASLVESQMLEVVTAIFDGEMGVVSYFD